MKLLVITLLWLITLADSTTLIKPGKQFVLGGNNNGAFTVRMRNVGKVPVHLAERQINGKVIELNTLRPSEQQALTFKAGSAALFTNQNNETVVLKLTLSGDRLLNMRYTD